MADHKYIDKMNELEAQEIEAAKRQEEQRIARAEEEAEQLIEDAFLQGGQAQHSDFINVTTKITKLAALKRVKDSKAYKAIKKTGGTWAGYCNLLGFSAKKIDKDLLNLKKLGEEFLEASYRMGLGYLQSLRKPQSGSN